MESSLKRISLVLSCLTLCIFQTFQYSSANNNGSRCGVDKFYCNTNGQCYDRSLRCTSARGCADSQDNCHPYNKEGGLYYYYKKRSPVLCSGSSQKKRSLEDVYHCFVEYRGFVCEFGSLKNYPDGAHELDINDPQYKYGPGGTKVLSVEREGYSRCTRDQVMRCVKRWNK